MTTASNSHIKHERLFFAIHDVQLTGTLQWRVGI